MIFCGVILIAAGIFFLSFGLYLSRYSFSKKARVRFEKLCGFLEKGNGKQWVYAVFGGIAVTALIAGGCMIYAYIYRKATSFPLTFSLAGVISVAALLILICALCTVLIHKYIVPMHLQIYHHLSGGDENNFHA